MKKNTAIGIVLCTSLLTITTTCLIANRKPTISFADIRGDAYSVTFYQSSITDDTYCGNDNGIMYLSSKVNTTNDILDLAFSYSINGTSHHNQYGKILRYDVSSSWEGEFSIDCTLWSGISNFSSIELNGSFTDIEEEVTTKLIYTEESRDLDLDLDIDENWIVHLSDSVFTIFELTSITINYTC